MNCYNMELVNLQELLKNNVLNYFKAKRYGVKIYESLLPKNVHNKGILPFGLSSINSSDKVLLTNRAYEAVFMDRELSKENDAFKSTIISNIVFPDTKGFMNVLIKNGYNFDDILLIVQLIYKADKLECENHVQNSRITRIYNTLIKYYGITDCKLIANKLIQIVAFEKNIYLALQNEHNQLFESSFQK